MGKKLDKTLLILALVVCGAVAVTFWKGGWPLTISGFTQAGHLLRTVGLRLLLGFTLGGLVQVLIPRMWVAKWLGPTSGLKGILIGSYAGVIMPGSPFITLPIIASIYKAGAGVGPVIALMTGRGLLSIQMLLVWQIPFLGVEVPLARYIVCLLVPPFVGLVGAVVFRVVTRPLPAADAGDYNIGDAGQQAEGTGDTRVTPEKEEDW